VIEMSVEEYTKMFDKRAELYNLLKEIGFSEERAIAICAEARMLMGD
jgi:hypothetical protein